MLGSEGFHSPLPAHPAWGLSLQVPEGVPHGAVPALRATQMHAAPALHLLPLALCEPATPPVHPSSGRHVQLQPRRLLHQVRRGHRPVPGGRRVSAPSLPSEEPHVFWVRCPQNRLGRVREASPRLLLGDCCSLASLPMAWTCLWGKCLLLSPLLGNPTQACLLLSLRASSEPKWLLGPLQVTRTLSTARHHPLHLTQSPARLAV